MENLQLGDLIAKRALLKAQRKESDAHTQKLDNLIADIDATIIREMDQLGLAESGDGENRVKIGESVVPQIESPESWDLVYNYIKENDAFYLLQKRFSVTAYRELLGLGKALPGVLPYTKRVIR